MASRSLLPQPCLDLQPRHQKLPDGWSLAGGTSAAPARSRIAALLPRHAPSESVSSSLQLGLAGCSVAAAVAISRRSSCSRPSAWRNDGRRSVACSAGLELPLGRRQGLASVGLVAATAGSSLVSAKDGAASGGMPPTVAREVIPGIYAFDQAYGIPGLGIGANIPIRMTAMRLRDGSVLLYNPCNPTEECVQKFKEFGLTNVKYIVLGTVAIEHKYYGPQWAALYPDAEVWISPRTFSWPVDFGPYVPFGGFPKGYAVNKIPKDASKAPWYDKGVDHLQLTVDYAPRTVFEETVLYHQETGTMVCTDMLIGLSNEPPEILKRSPYREGCLYFSRNTPLDVVDVGSDATVRDGYQKSTLLLNNINPRSLLSYAAGDFDFASQVSLAFQDPQPQLGYYGWYPCNWQEADAECAKLDEREKAGESKDPKCRRGWRGEWGRLIKGVENTGFQVPSFVAELQISRDPEAVASFAAEIESRWSGIKQVIPSHFDAPLPATASNVSKAIAAVSRGPPPDPARAADLSAILNFKDYLETNELIYRPAAGRGQWRPA